MAQYLVALHVAASIIVHPISAQPTSSSERLIFLALLFWGGFIWTQIISRSTSIATSMDRHNIFYKQTMDDLNIISDNLGLTPALKRKLRGFFMCMKDWSQRTTWEELTKR